MSALTNSATFQKMLTRYKGYPIHATKEEAIEFAMCEFVGEYQGLKNSNGVEAVLCHIKQRNPKAFEDGCESSCELDF